MDRAEAERVIKDAEARAGLALPGQRADESGERLSS
jgi:hypothetical protein